MKRQKLKESRQPPLSNICLPTVIVIHISSFLKSSLNLWKTSKTIHKVLTSYMIFTPDQIHGYNMQKLQISENCPSGSISMNMKELHIIDNKYALRYLYIDDLKCIYSPNATAQQRTNDVLQIHSKLDNLRLLCIHYPISILFDSNLQEIKIQTLILKHNIKASFDFFQKCTHVKFLEINAAVYIKFQEFGCCQDLTQLTIHSGSDFNVLQLQDKAEKVTIFGNTIEIEKLPQNMTFLNIEYAYNCKITTNFPICLKVLKLSHLKSKKLQKISQSNIGHLSFKSISQTIQYFDSITLPTSLLSLTISKKLLQILNLDHCRYDIYQQKLDDSLCVFQCNQTQWNPIIKIK
jgi:hypothetical protein